MARSQQRILSQLASSPNELASGLGQCLESLRLISVLPRCSPVYIQYGSASSPMIKAFGREHLSRIPLRSVITLIRSSMNLADNLHVASALFYREDGSVDPTQVLIDEDSWKELAPYIHTLHVEDREVGLTYERDRPPTALSVISLNSTASPTSKSSGINSNGSTLIPSSTGIVIKTIDGANSPRAISPFVILDKGTGGDDWEM